MTGDGLVLRDVVGEEWSPGQADAGEERVVVVVGAVRGDVDEVVRRRASRGRRTALRGLDGASVRPRGGDVLHLPAGEREPRSGQDEHGGAARGSLCRPRSQPVADRETVVARRARRGSSPQGAVARVRDGTTTSGRVGDDVRQEQAVEPAEVAGQRVVMAATRSGSGRSRPASASRSARTRARGR